MRGHRVHGGDVLCGMLANVEPDERQPEGAEAAQDIEEAPVRDEALARLDEGVVAEPERFRQRLHFLIPGV